MTVLVTIMEVVGMAKNICPRCCEVILSFGIESSMECLKCGTVFEVNNTEDDNANAGAERN